MKTAIFLGAGASAGEGAPLQSDLFREYFKSAKDRLRPDETHSTYSRLSSFFRNMFGISVWQDDLGSISFPTFEEALGILDLAELRKESFQDYSFANYPAESDRDVRFIRMHLIALMARIIKEKLEKSKGIHKLLIENLLKRSLLNNTFFITTNYDILIDNALLNFRTKVKIDYGLDFANIDDLNTSERPDPSGIKLYKLHGSLNWLYCATCNTLKLTPFKKSYSDFVPSCPNCRSFYSPIIVPPTFFKDMSNVFLSTIWNKAENSLREAENIVFCGYSFPDADMHIKYLLKRIELNRRANSLKVEVINYHEGKSDELSTSEENRYRRFFSCDVSYEKVSFEQFANNPYRYIIK